MMRIKPIAILLIGSIFFISLSLLLFSAFHIFTSNSNINETLDKWENQRLSESDGVVELETSLIDERKFMLINEKNSEELVTNTLYSSRPKRGEVFGKIVISSLNKELPIIEGSDEAELAKGVGHYIGSVLPGETDNSVLAGHRDTVFRGLGEIKIDDLIEITTSAGIFIYKVSNTKIVNSDDRTVIVPYDRAILTLVTCYPFDYIGNAPQRFIVTAELVEI